VSPAPNGYIAGLEKMQLSRPRIKSRTGFRGRTRTEYGAAAGLC
jgi:hypothetical protein